MLRPRLLAKSRPMHNHDMLLPDELLNEDFIAFGYIKARESIERSARRNATHPRRRFAPFLGEIAARSELALQFRQMILWSFQCSLPATGNYHITALAWGMDEEILVAGSSLSLYSTHSGAEIIWTNDAKNVLSYIRASNTDVGSLFQWWRANG